MFKVLNLSLVVVGLQVNILWQNKLLQFVSCVYFFRTLCHGSRDEQIRNLTVWAECTAEHDHGLDFCFLNRPLVELFESFHNLMLLNHMVAQWWPCCFTAVFPKPWPRKGYATHFGNHNFKAKIKIQIYFLFHTKKPKEKCSPFLLVVAEQIVLQCWGRTSQHQWTSPQTFRLHLTSLPDPWLPLYFLSACSSFVVENIQFLAEQ